MNLLQKIESRDKIKEQTTTYLNSEREVKVAKYDPLCRGHMSLNIRKTIFTEKLHNLYTLTIRQWHYSYEEFNQSKFIYIYIWNA